MSTQVAPAAQPASTPEPGPYQTATHKGISVTSNTDSAENMQSTLAFDEKADATADQGSAPPTKDTEAKPDVKAKAPAKADAPGGPERGPDGRWLPKDAKGAEISGDPVEKSGPEAEISTEKRKGSPRHDPIARMEEVTREAAALKRDLAMARQELAAARSTPRPQPAPQPSYQAPPAGDEPKAENFKNYEDFVDARATYRANQAIEARIARMSQDAQAQEKAARYQSGVQTAVSRMSQKAEELRQSDAEEHASLMDFAAKFEPVIGMAPGTRPGPMNALGDEIIASSEPIEVLRYLRDNPDTLQRIATLRTSREVAREVAKIEDRIEARSQAQAAAPAGTAPKPVSQAPRPVRPVTGGRTASDSSEPDDSMSDAEYFRRRMAQGLRRGRR